MCRRTVTTLVHNDHLAELVRSFGTHATVVPDVPIVFAATVPFQRTDAFTVAVVCSFNYDEPVEAILDAAAMLPDVRFFVTGNPRHLSPELAARLPANVTLTGFLNTAAYGGLLGSTDVVMSLTTRDHTMLRGAYEAIYQGTPVIVSNWGLLKTAFPSGAVSVDNTPTGIADAIRQMREHLDEYRRGARKLREVKTREWAATRASILSLLGPRGKGT
jgi:glycosyltransferase involved in cell wall biosynthesis